jgi:hypothetical protein
LRRRHGNYDVAIAPHPHKPTSDKQEQYPWQ